MVYKTKTYVAFDGDSEMAYYKTMKMWDQNNSIDFNLHNAHDIKQARDTSSDDSIKRSLRERIRASKVLILIVGKETHHHTRFVKYEVEYAQSLNLPIILDVLENGVIPRAWFENYPAITVPFKLDSIKLALNEWPASTNSKPNGKNVGFYHYKN